MTPRTDWTELFFSSSGRAGQAPSTIAAGVLLLILAMYESLVTGPLQYMTGWIVYPVLLFSGACVLSKRLHDRGRSGWWAAVILAAFVMVWPAPHGFFDFLAVLVLVWALIDLCVMPGERGDNRYGPTLYRSLAREPN
ncbi:DUF805 domain-containing protein [Asticcacaulis sp. EMRT-3]|uniref:DUF805 domain-containing protein n=1 Tax=Asticcacaulis sp. EMRT-3 TaxID=3040349 RepID=UPI0024AFFE51|nr:DUF805 domain-containing protein [Asticcacaulis sp. EMRT-3]MDI7775042.1 DUF805 domain-containing protein [Asticcacaulis sp. EMRT-3]